LVQQQIKDDLISKLAPRGVIVEDVLLRDVQLPPLLKASIEAKQQAEQDALRMSLFCKRKARSGPESIERRHCGFPEDCGARNQRAIIGMGRASKRRRNWQRARTRRSV